jgi:hypothetical protein
LGKKQRRKSLSKATSSRKANPSGATEICVLTNSIFYFINSVFIIWTNNHYQLVANHKGKLLINRRYRSLRGAKIAFSKLFGHRGWKEDLAANWSVFYKPDARWLREKSKGFRMPDY